jgi:hypothetical protein
MPPDDPRMTIAPAAPAPRLSGERVLLPIPAEAWAPPSSPVRLREGIELAPKSELHITLVGSRLGSGLRRNLGEAFLDDALHAALAQADWRFRRSGRLLLLRKRDHGGEGGGMRLRHALVEPVRLPAMAGLHRVLGRLLGRQLPVPPPHATLYVAGDPQGIGLPSRAMLRACTVREVAAAELAQR